MVWRGGAWGRGLEPEPPLGLLARLPRSHGLSVHQLDHALLQVPLGAVLRGDLVGSSAGCAFLRGGLAVFGFVLVSAVSADHLGTALGREVAIPLAPGQRRGFDFPARTSYVRYPQCQKSGSVT